MEELKQEDRGGDHDNDRQREREFSSKSTYVRCIIPLNKWVVWYSVLPEDDTTIAYNTHLFPQKLGPVSTYHSRKFRGQKISQFGNQWDSIP